MKKTLIFAGAILFSSLMIVSCKKDYTCVCGDSEGEFNAFTVTTTEDRAKEQCDTFYVSQYQFVGTDTTCSIR